MHWVCSKANSSEIAALANGLNVSPVVADLLAKRGFQSVDEASAFLNAALTDLADPLLVGQMESAVACLEVALQKQYSVLIFGDYDVDGVTSTTLLTHFLRQFGLNPRFVVPRRLEEGYGLSMESLKRAIAIEKPDLLIAVDCGTSSAKEVQWLRENDIEVLIIDHHASKESLPEDCVLVNPHVNDRDDVPWKHLCTVGLVFKYCHAVIKVLRQKKDPLAEKMDLRQYLDLVAMGTVADLVHLTGENRILVKSGLKALKACRRPGICALMDAAGIKLGENLSASDIGYKLGPRINASGRLDDATLPIELLLGEDWHSCRNKARILNQHNLDRQEIERQISREAEEEAQSKYADTTGLVLYQPHWHTGVVGIVASRLARQFKKPALVLGADEDICKGSGRSIKGVNLVELLSSSADVLDKWGGHPMAVGVSIRAENIAAFREAFNTALKQTFPGGLPDSPLEIDAIVEPEDLTIGLLEQIEALAPFGQGMPEPVFALLQVDLKRAQNLKNGHFKFFLENRKTGNLTEGVAWNLKDRPDTSQPVDLAIRFHWHSWRGERQPRMTLIDWKQPSASLG